MVAGVAGGLAQYFNIDPVLVRLAFVILTLGSGAGVLAYILLALLVPERPVSDEEPQITASFSTGRGREIVGYGLAALGVIILADNLNLLRFVHWDSLWPIVLIGAGIALLITRARN
jgi:phage shock protein C